MQLWDLEGTITKVGTNLMLGGGLLKEMMVNLTPSMIKLISVHFLLVTRV